MKDSSEIDRLLRAALDEVKDHAILLLGLDGSIRSWNAAAQHMTGWSDAEILGKSFRVFYPQESLDRGLADVELALASTDGRYEDEGWRVRKDGSRFWANVVVTALHGKDGALQGFCKITRDLSARRKVDEELRRSEERFRLLVEGTDDAMYVLDPEGLVISWNTGAQRIKGYSASEVIGSHYSRFYLPEEAAAGRPQQNLRIALTNGRYHEEGWRVRKDGTRFWAGVTITALRDAEGGHYGFAKVTSDLTQSRRISELEEGERQTNEFLAMLGHELRNPLAPIRNAVAVIGMHDPSDPVIARARDVIDRQTTHIARLVDDLLDIGRITRGMIQIRKDVVSVASAVNQAIETVSPLLEAKKHRLELVQPEESLTVEGDHHRLTQALHNLLHNAAKYTPEGGSIRVAVQRENGEVAISVRDSGVGIPPEMLSKVFELFVQGDRTLARSEGGLGIGLSLVRRIVKLHGGRVDAFSAGPSHGAEFVVRLPLKKELAAVAHLPGPRTRSTAPLHPVGRGDASASRALVVDDNLDAADTLAMVLRSWGHDVRIAHDGPAALALAQKHRPQLVLLDIGLPGMDGYELAQRLREVEGMKDVPLVAVTGYGRNEDRARSREAGIQHHLVKPVDLDELAQLLGREAN